MLSRRSLAALATIALLALSIGSIETAAEPLKLLRDEGWIVDDQYGKKHANPDSKQAVLNVLETGQPLVYWSEKEDRYYQVADQEAAKAWIARRVQILGNVLPDGTLRIGNFRAAPRKDS